MSNPQTYYIVGGQDLSGIFQPYISGSNAATGYKISGGQDLSGIFQPLGTNEQTSSTGYIVNNYAGVSGQNWDLNKIFAPVSQYNGIWPYINLNNKNTRQSIYNGPSITSPPVTKWLYQALSSATFNENQLVIGPTGIIYIVANNGDIYALQDLGTGIQPNLLFSFNTGYSSLLPPAIGINNIMFFAGTNTIKAVQNITTISPSVLWSLTITSPSLTNPKSPIIGANNTIYLSTSNGYIFAINNIYVLLYCIILIN